MKHYKVKAKREDQTDCSHLLGFKKDSPKQTKSPTKYISKYAQEKAGDTSSCNEIFLSTDTSDPKSDLSFAYPVSYEGFSMY